MTQPDPKLAALLDHYVDGMALLADLEADPQAAAGMVAHLDQFRVGPTPGEQAIIDRDFETLYVLATRINDLRAVIEYADARSVEQAVVVEEEATGPTMVDWNRIVAVTRGHKSHAAQRIIDAVGLTAGLDGQAVIDLATFDPGDHPDARNIEANHYDWFMPENPTAAVDVYLSDFETKMRKALTDPFVHDMAQSVLPLIAAYRTLRRVARENPLKSSDLVAVLREGGWTDGEDDPEHGYSFVVAPMRSGEVIR